MYRSIHTIPWVCYRRRNQWLRLALALFCLPLMWLARVVYLLPYHTMGVLPSTQPATHWELAPQGNRAGGELLHRVTGTCSAKDGAAATGRQRKNGAGAAGARVRRGRLPPGTHGARWELALLGKKGARACRAWARHRPHQGGGAGQQAWA